MSVSPLVVSYGGGVDSFAVCIGFQRLGIRPDAIVFADTGGEKSETYDYMQRYLSPWLAKHNFPPLIVVRRPDFGRSKTGDQTLEDECLRLGTPPSRAFGFSTCADKWKIDPFNWWARGWTEKFWRNWDASDGWAGLTAPMVVCVGFEYGEENRVSLFTERGQLKRYPLIEWKWDRDTCEAAILAEGLPLPIKSACFFCPSSTKNEVLWLANAHPDLMMRALRIEGHANAQLDEHGNKRWSVKGLGRRFAWAELIAADARAREEFPDAPVEPCTKCNDGGCEVTA